MSRETEDKINRVIFSSIASMLFAYTVCSFRFSHFALALEKRNNGVATDLKLTTTRKEQ